MITVRAIAPDESAHFAALGDADVHETLLETWKQGSSRPEWTLLAEADGRPIARGALVAEPIGGGVETLEGTAAFLWVDANHPQHLDAFRALTDALAEQLAPLGPTTLDRRLNPEVHDVELMRRLLEAAGFGLLQEKAGFAWTPSVPPPAVGDDLQLLTFADVGPDRFRQVMAATTEGTLDRNDRYYVDRCGPLPWATEIMGAMADGDEQSWLTGQHGGEDAGFIGVSAFDDVTWTIVHVGVVPEHRGHGHIHGLLAAADAAARRRGFTAGLSDVDVVNAPMLAAMKRAGHRTDLRPWHVWHYRREVPRRRV